MFEPILPPAPVENDIHCPHLKLRIESKNIQLLSVFVTLADLQEVQENQGDQASLWHDRPECRPLQEVSKPIRGEVLGADVRLVVDGGYFVDLEQPLLHVRLQPKKANVHVSDAPDAFASRNPACRGRIRTHGQVHDDLEELVHILNENAPRCP